MSTGGGPNSEIAKLSIGIEATGADAAVRDLESVRVAAEKTAESVRKATSFNQASYPIDTPEQSRARHGMAGEYDVVTGAYDVIAAQEKVKAATKEEGDAWAGYKVKLDAATEARQRFVRTGTQAARATQQATSGATGLASALRPLSIFTRIAGAAGLFAGALAQGYEGIQKYRSAAADLNDELKKIGEGFKVSTTFGEADGDTLRKQADAAKEAALQAEKLRVASRGWREGFMETVFGEVSNKAIVEQINSQHAAALQQIDAREKNKRDKDAADDAEKLAKEQDAYDKAQAERTEKARQRAMAETEDLRKQALMAGMSDREKVIFEFEEKVKQAYQRIAETEDATIKYAFEERIGYLNQLRDAQLKVIDERAAKEADAARQAAEETATAYRSAIESASRSAADALRSQLDISGISTQLEGVADLLDMIARQRGVR